MTDLLAPGARSRAVLGMTRSGKGELLKKKVIPAMLAAGRSVVVIDVDDEYSVHGKAREGNSLGPLTLRVEAPDFKRWLAANVATFRGPGLALSVVPVSPYDDEDEIAAQIYAVLPAIEARGDVDVIFEEMPSWAEANEKIQKVLKVVATRWLKEGVRSWFIAQGYRYLPLKMRTQIAEVISFKQVDSADINFVGRDCGRGFAAEIVGLPVGHFRVRLRAEVDPELLKRLAATPADLEQEEEDDGGREEVLDG